MSRWHPNARGRLEQAALELYRERGYEQTTVADIAARAGLVERTFFRHFADKREVLFGGAGALQALLVEKVAEAPLTQPPIDAVIAAFAATALFGPERRDHARQRQAILKANAELQERELMKLASLSAALAEVLRSRGLPDSAARLSADAGTAVFMAAFTRWIDDPDQQAFGELLHQALGELRAVVMHAPDERPAHP